MAFENLSFNSISSLLETLQQRIIETDAKNEELEEEISELEQQRILNVPNNQGMNEYSSCVSWPHLTAERERAD
ncbi:repeat domain-containing protein-containing [Wuchereria bancrofti]|uniref:Repeat domain-containing protein-containing n=1 Tax=Wuchereria bancrofti TaxID=6293 RepID=J9E2G2_WUCBA|nr:repeat domain-containing protein-containing [Wuchereria bancrofti]